MTTTTKTASRPRLEPRQVGHWIDDWRPEDPEFWNTTGATIARRNLIFSVASEHIGFSVWTLWSVLVLFLGPDYGFDVSQKFLLTAVPSLLGSLVRVPYTFAVAVFGGRNWTVISAALLLVPTIAIATKHALRSKMISNVEQVQARGGKVLAIVTEGDDELARLADGVVTIPEVSELLEPIVASIPLQLLAYYVAVHRGCDVDQPRNLAKTVTVE